jgi:hypothetical protein
MKIVRSSNRNASRSILSEDLEAQVWQPIILGLYCSRGSTTSDAARRLGPGGVGRGTL